MMRSFTSAYLTLLSATLILSFLTLINASPSNLESRQSTVPSGSGQIQVLSESGDALMGCLNSAGQFVVDDSECGIFRAMPVNNAVSAFKSSQGLCFFDSTNGSYNYMCDYKSTSNLVGSSFGIYNNILAVGDYRNIFNVAVMPTSNSPQHISVSQVNSNPVVVQLRWVNIGEQ